MVKARVCILRTAGTNCDKETAFAFSRAGASRADLVHVNTLINGRNSLQDYQILAFPGGFSYGDDLGAGKILANELKYKLAGELRRFISEGKLIIGICNGFQILVKSGLLPGGGEGRQEASLILNDSAKFEDRWVYLKSSQFTVHSSQRRCIWIKDLPETIYLPVAHGEGKFVVREKKILERMRRGGQVVFRYCDEKGMPAGYPYNPNGAQDNIAGICDPTGRILGMMPHPERHISFSQHPRWSKRKKYAAGDGILIFQNGVSFAKKHL